MNGNNWKDFFYIKDLEQDNRLWGGLAVSTRWAIYCVHSHRNVNNTVYHYEYEARKAAKLMTYHINKKAQNALLKETT